MQQEKFFYFGKHVLNAVHWVRGKSFIWKQWHAGENMICHSVRKCSFPVLRKDSRRRGLTIFVLLSTQDNMTDLLAMGWDGRHVTTLFMSL